MHRDFGRWANQARGATRWPHELHERSLMAFGCTHRIKVRAEKSVDMTRKRGTRGGMRLGAVAQLVKWTPEDEERQSTPSNGTHTSSHPTRQRDILGSECGAEPISGLERINPSGLRRRYSRVLNGIQDTKRPASFGMSRDAAFGGSRMRVWRDFGHASQNVDQHQRQSGDRLWLVCSAVLDARYRSPEPTDTGDRLKV